MAIKIEVDGLLASLLQTKAADRMVSPQEFARNLLSKALVQLVESEQWSSQNQRRIELIKKNSAGSLSQAERHELQTLQQAADKQLEERDHQLLEQLEQFKQRATNLASNTDSD